MANESSTSLSKIVLITGIIVTTGYLLLRQQSPSKSDKGLQRSNALRRPTRSSRSHSQPNSQSISQAHSHLQTTSSGDESLENEVEIENKSTGPSVAPGLESLVYHISENNAKTQTVIHHGIYCDDCNTIIRGVRFKCLNCVDHDICEPCEARNQPHNLTHILCKIRIPAPFITEWEPRPVDYPVTDNSTNEKYLDHVCAKALAAETNQDIETIRALFEQFKTIATAKYRRPGHSAVLALDRPTFHKVFFPETTGMDIIQQRLFDVWSNEADLITFEAFATHVLHVLDPLEKRKFVFNVLDIDQDKRITRNDFLITFDSFYDQRAAISHRHFFLKAQDDMLSDMTDDGPWYQPNGTLSSRLQYFDQHMFPIYSAEHLTALNTPQDIVELPKSFRMSTLIRGSRNLDNPTLEELVNIRNQSSVLDNEFAPKSGIKWSHHHDKHTLKLLTLAAWNDRLDGLFLGREKLLALINLSKPIQQKLKVELQTYRKLNPQKDYILPETSNRKHLIYDQTLPQNMPLDKIELQVQIEMIHCLIIAEETEFQYSQYENQEVSISFEVFCQHLDVTPEDQSLLVDPWFKMIKY